MRFLFLNQYTPPDPAPTARLLGELADGLRAEGHVVDILSQRQSYQGRPARDGRLRRELLASWAILRSGLLAIGGKPDVILALTSPPGLPVIGALLAWRHRARLAHWAMDLYPELALALGEIHPASAVGHLAGAATRWAYRRCSLVVALDEDMRDHLQAFCRVPVNIMPPWSAHAMEQVADEATSTNRTALETSHAVPPTICLYSGNLGRAHEWKTLLHSQALLEKRGLGVTLVFQGDGAGRLPAIEYAKGLGLNNCWWKGYAPEEKLLESLLQARVLMVTQRPETRRLLWPSKLALIERLPALILFVGPEDGAIARRLRNRGNAGIFSPGDSAAVALWIEDVHCGKVVWDPARRFKYPTAAEQQAILRNWLLECGQSQ